MGPVLLEHPSSLEHDTGDHPERAARIVAIDQHLANQDWLGFERIRSPAVDRDLLSAVHPARYVDAIERFCAAGGGALDLDTIVGERSFTAALHAVGGAVRLVELLLDGAAPVGFSAHRPPGHHALADRAMGFCVFNNIAVAVRYALDVRGLERVMIVDWDVHHGNGTNDIFYACDRVLFVSIHQSPLYPGSGAASDVGEGAGKGFTVNLPVAPRSDDAVYVSLVERVVGPLAREFEPQLMLISAGYDAHRDDPLAQCGVTERGFAAMTRSLRRACHAVEAPLGAVLEGGYALQALAGSVAATLAALREPVPEQGQSEMTPAAVAAVDRLSRWWPRLKRTAT